jgi:hypothetical protein
MPNTAIKARPDRKPLCIVNPHSQKISKLPDEAHVAPPGKLIYLTIAYYRLFMFQKRE